MLRLCVEIVIQITLYKSYFFFSFRELKWQKFSAFNLITK